MPETAGDICLARRVGKGDRMKRSEIRENIFKLVFCGEFHTSNELEDQLNAYLEDVECTDQERSYIAAKFEGICEKITEIDEAINQVAKGWKTGRMNKVDLTILRLAVYEILWDEDIPSSVAINEAVELAKKFSGEDGPSFVNGVLAKFV